MKVNFKNKITAMALAGLSVMSLVACSDDFLDRKPGGSTITDGQISELTKVNGAQIMLGQTNGVTSNLVRWQTGGTTEQSDFGQKSVDISTDLMSGDMVFSLGCSYGWFGADARCLCTNSTQNRAYQNWRYYYRVISSCNSILDAISTDGEQPENAELQLSYGVAKAVRAFSYFNLVNLYAKSYDLSKDKRVLPVYDKSVNVGGKPQTVDSVYRFVVKDLNEAIVSYEAAAQQGITPTDISQPGIDVAYTILAYAYLQTGQNDKAQAAAEAALASTTKEILPASGLFYGFNTVNNDNWMWGVDITSDNTGGLCTFWGMMDYFTYSYAAAGDFKVMNSDLFQQMAGDDARIGWFTALAGANPKYLLPAGKFFDSARVPMGDGAWTNDIHFFRVEEPVMIVAEAAARQGDLTTARQYLGALLAERSPSRAAAIETMTQDELLEEILTNWRVEFWGEGRSLMTLKRFKKGMVRPANDYYQSITQNGAISYDDNRMIFAIPRTELENNANMKEAEM